MTSNAIRGKKIRWTFHDGPMANKSFEHEFDDDGTVTWRMIESGNRDGKASHAVKYESVVVGDRVHAVSYLGTEGYTLTVVLDFRTGDLVAFASNEKELTVQRGSFEVARSAVTGPLPEHHRS